MEEQIELYTKIVGVTFENRQDIIANLTVSHKIILVREPDNKFDKNAIKVIKQPRMGDALPADLGFINKELASDLGPAMDEGNFYEAKIMSITGGDKDQYGVNIKIWKVEK